MRNALYVLAFAALLLFGVHRIRLALETDEEAVRRTLQLMARGFNETTLRHVLRGIDRGYEDEDTGHDRDDVRQALQHMFWTEKHPETRGFPYRLEIPEDELAVEWSESRPERADVDLHAIFTKRGPGGVEELWWDAHLEGEMRKHEGSWRLVATRGVNHADRPGAR